jgi:hypothetical protein
MDTFYAPAGTVGGSWIHYSEIDRDRSEYWGKTVAITFLPRTQSSDYSGSLVEASNRRVLLDDPEIAPLLVSVIGSHGSAGIAYLGTDEDPPDALADTLSALADCGYLDSDDLSHLEIETESAAWESDGDRDFRRALAILFADLDADPDVSRDDFDLDGIQADRIFDLWRRGCDAYNVNGGSGCMNEVGDAIHFCIDEWYKRAGENSARMSDYARRAATTLRADLIALAAECRIPDSE